MSGQRITIEALPETIKGRVNELMGDISKEVQNRGFRAANELRNAEQLVLRGQRSGRRYRVPGSKSYYTASAPGEPPAVRTGTYRNSFSRRSYADGSPDNVLKVHAIIESRITIPNGRNLGNLLEGGTGRMAPRPHKDAIIEKAKPNIKRIYTGRYL